MVADTETAPRVTSPTPARFGVVGGFVAAATLMYLALNEVSILSSGFVTQNGYYSSFSALSAPNVWDSRYTDGWRYLLTETQLAGWQALLTRFYLPLDVLFIGLYTIGLLLLARLPLRRLAAAGNGNRDAGARRARRRAFVASTLIAVLACADLTEDVLMLMVAERRCTSDGAEACAPPDGLITAVTAGTAVKWLLVVAALAGTLAALAALAHDSRSSSTGAVPPLGFRARARQILSALKVQRFSVLSFAPIAALAVLPLDDLANRQKGSSVFSMFGQLPDVERSWLDGGRGVWHAMAAAGVFAAVVLLIFYLGRLRADFAARRVAGGTLWPFFDVVQQPGDTDGAGNEGGGERDGDGGSAAGSGDLEGVIPPRERTPRWQFWATGPVLLLILAVVVTLWPGGEVYWRRLVTFCAVPVAVVALSWLANKLRHQAPPRARLTVRNPGWARDVMAVGDIVSAAAVSLAGIAMIRAYTPLVALDSINLLDLGTSKRVLLAVLVVVGVAVALLPWVLAGPVLDAIHRAGTASPVPDADALAETNAVGLGGRPGEYLARAVSPGADEVPLEPGDGGTWPEGFRSILRKAMLAYAVLGFLLLSVFPGQVAHAIGMLGAGMAGLGTLVGLAGSIVILIQDRQPMQLFGAIPVVTFKATPAVSLLVFATVVASLAGRQPDAHSVTGSGTVPDRPTMAEAFAAWLDQPDRCRIRWRGHDGMWLRPMLMYAAEGGGIRATYWTASALQAVSTAGPVKEGKVGGCGARAALFSSGASGGALGLTLGRYTGTPRTVAETMAGPDALAVAAIGLTSSDLLASGAGIRFPSYGAHRGPSWEGRDRAGQMELAWERSKALAELQGVKFLPDKADDATRDQHEPAVSGQLILNTTSAVDGCRAVLSQVDLSDGTKEHRGWPRCGGGDAGRGSYDIFAAYGAQTAGKSSTQGEQGKHGEHCLRNIPALTGGLLSARFPGVEPSGVVGPCADTGAVPLVDGGLVDNTGLTTISALGDLWAPLVAQHNDKTLKAGTGEVVVPMVVFLDNGTGSAYSFASDEQDQQDEQGEETNAHQGGQQQGDSAGLPGPSWWAGRVTMPEIGAEIGAMLIKGRYAESLQQGLDDARRKTRKALCTAQQPGCDALRTDSQVAGLPRVYVIHQQIQPAVQAALGWTLSEASREDQRNDMKVMRAYGREVRTHDPASRDGYGTLRDLLDAMGLRPQD